MRTMLIERFYAVAFAAIFIAGDTRGQSNGPISDSTNTFSTHLLMSTTELAGNSINVAISPYSVWSLLSIIAEGAQSRTFAELETALNLPNDKNQFRNDFKNLSDVLGKQSYGVNVDISNAIFTSNTQKLKDPYRQLVKKYYEVDITPTDFSNALEAAKNINNYIAKATKNRITNFLDDSDLKGAEVFLTSALYFKGQWQLPFNRSATNTESFFDEKGAEMGKVDLMFSKAFYPFSRVDEIRAHAIELPYGNGDKMSMIIVLPYIDQTTMEVLSLMTELPFRNIIAKLNKARDEFNEEEVLVYLPKFTVESNFNLNLVLQKMGVRDLFHVHEADLLGMFPDRLHVSRLIQHTKIEVNEEGTVAASVSGATFTYKSPPPRFKVNRPFLYFIVDKTADTIIFAGRVSNPHDIR